MSNQDLWEQKYKNGHSQQYPWDCIVSFVFKYAPKDKERSSIKILELGCGTGGNLKFIAEQGFQPFGIELSLSAVKYAQDKLQAFSVPSVNIVTGNFVTLPYSNETFDLIIDRASLCCVDKPAYLKSLQEAHRVLNPGGMFFSQTYGREHTSASSGKLLHSGMTIEISDGTLTTAGDIRFSDLNELKRIFQSELWELNSLKNIKIVEHETLKANIHEEYMVIAQKK
mgnify:CR=1 FL=1